MRSFILLLLVGLSWSACNELSEAEQQQAEDNLWEVVMHGHDEVMPLTGELSNVSRALKNSVMARTDATEELRDQVRDTVEEMQEAEEEMFEWMSEIKQVAELRKEKSHKEIMNYLEDQKKTMEKVREMTVSSLQNGKTLLQEMQAQPTQ